MRVGGVGGFCDAIDFGNWFGAYSAGRQSIMLMRSNLF